MSLLAVGGYTYTSDLRLESRHEAGTRDWDLIIRNVSRGDGGHYECQVSTRCVLTMLMMCVRSPPRPTCPPSSPSTLKVSSDESTVKRRKISFVCLDIMGYCVRPELGKLLINCVCSIIINCSLILLIRDALILIAHENVHALCTGGGLPWVHFCAQGGPPCVLFWTKGGQPRARRATSPGYKTVTQG